MTDSERERLKIQLQRHEGVRLRPYTDTVGKLTIGVGRNLTDMGITLDEAMMMLDHDIDRCVVELATAFPWFISLDPMRQRVCVDLCFNMGIARLSGFKNTLAAVARRDYDAAAQGLHDSKWYGQVGRRGPWLVEALRTGVEPD